LVVIGTAILPSLRDWRARPPAPHGRGERRGRRDAGATLV